ncbi:hypothetical protein [Cupriavidus sp. D39]|uniref:hypothetical protein n=1 Tax=Cupriavidus sp. D39 TaxID=2997877 RepID=UPI002271C1C9|nr:hypothetical protein [Cupriavidus sp. D39]MCY0853038.1 hypothetical protein [Cupriavidus sp. D39]
MKSISHVFGLAVMVMTSIAASATFAATPFVPGPSTITVANQTLGCAGRTPVVTLNLLVNPEDAGRPGLIYVGVHDPQQMQAALLNQDSAWEAFTGAALIPHIVRRDGLSSVRLNIPLSSSPSYQGWSLYVGYGALTLASEAMVQKAVVAVAGVKARYPDRPVPAVDEDHFKRSLIQEDMRKNTKYRFVRAFTPELMSICEPLGGN